MRDVDRDFADLLARVRAGDEAALAEFVEVNGETIRRTARALLGPLLRQHLDTMDLFQSVHHTLLLGLRHQKFDVGTPQQLIALATTLLRRKVARHWRRTKNDPAIRAEADGANGEAEHIPEGWGSDPADVLPQTEQAARLLASLDKIDRRLLELRLDGHSTADAGRELGVDPGMLRVRLARLRRRLRDDGLLDGLV